MEGRSLDRSSCFYRSTRKKICIYENFFVPLQTNWDIMRQIFLFLSLVLCSMSLWSAERCVEDAAAIAEQFVMKRTPARKALSDQTSSPMRLVYTCARKTSPQAAFYVFNRGEKEGFVVVSGDDRTREIVMYADKGSFDANRINPNMQFWLNRLQEEVSSLTDEDITSYEATENTVTPIAPMLVVNGQEIQWHQWEPYNRLCPIDNLDTTRSATGCVATAMAQIMYKYRYPVKGVGTKTYLWGNPNVRAQSEYLTADFGNTTYDWDNMLPTYTEGQYTDQQATAVATLMYHLGVASEMVYGGVRAAGSATWGDILAKGVTEHLGYRIAKYVTQYSQEEYELGGLTPSAFSPTEFSVTTEQLGDYINADLEAGRPVLMGGETRSGSAGHEFVCDGRDENGLLHINWGWSGNGNCYCALTSLKPSTQWYVFSTNMDAIIGLEPNTPTALETIDDAQCTMHNGRYIINNQFVIIREGNIYNAFGNKVK